MRRAFVLLLLTGLGWTWYAALPSRAQRFEPDSSTPTGIRGVVHVHTNRSDGTGSIEDIAAAAARAGLDFVVFTDHGDATRAPDPPRFRSGVLCIDAVEISTNGGHVIALGLPAAPYPLGGEARDVLEDIDRLGGFAIAAHPGSRKSELRWIDWTLPVGGLEWLNGDSEWRDESAWTLLRALLTYPLRGTETLSSLLDRPASVMRQWDALAAHRRVVGLAGTDAHARIGLGSLGEPYDSRVTLRVPSYERMMGVFSNVLPDMALTGDAEADARAVIAAIRAGRLYSVIDGLAVGTLSFTATAGGIEAVPGGVITAEAPVTLRAAAQAPPGARVALLKDGSVVATGSGAGFEHVVDRTERGAYRLEVRLAGAPGQPPIPWIVSNPIYVGHGFGANNDATQHHPAASRFAVQYDGGPAARWMVETSTASLAAIDTAPGTAGAELALRYGLGGAASGSPYAAFAMAAGPALAEYDRLVFTARADRPMRLSVQLREPGGDGGERWHRSVFVDDSPREITVHFDDVRPIGVTTRERPTLGNVESILFVVDTVNTPLGGSGRLWIGNVRYAK